MTSEFLLPVTEIFVFPLILVSWIPRFISMSLPFPWSQLEKGSSQFWFRLGSRHKLHSLTQTESPICFSTIKSETLYFFTENRVYRTPNTLHHHPGQECPKCEWVYVRSGLTDSWSTSSIYTDSARPILSFLRSKTKKYSLRKTSPRNQVSVDLLTIFSLKME